jgi:hypothetical protein
MTLFEFGRDEGARIRRPVERDDPEIGAGLLPARVDDERAAVGGRLQGPPRAGDHHGLGAAVARDAVDARHPVARGRLEDRTSVGRPDGKLVQRRIAGQAVARSSRHVDRPEIAGAGFANGIDGD